MVHYFYIISNFIRKIKVRLIGLLSGKRVIFSSFGRTLKQEVVNFSNFIRKIKVRLNGQKYV